MDDKEKYNDTDFREAASEEETDVEKNKCGRNKGYTEKGRQ